MTDLRTSILMQFDELIVETADLLATMPNQSWDRISMRIAYEETSEAQKNKFYSIRSRYLKLLTSIPSNDENLHTAIEHVRSIDPLEFNIEKMLSRMRELKSDYEAGILGASKSSGNTNQTIEYMLKEALHEAEYFQPPFPQGEIDHLEQTTKRAARMGFGEDSSHYKDIHQIFHPSAGIFFAGESADQKLQRHIEKWNTNRERLINILQGLPDEFKLTKQKESEEKSSLHGTDDLIIKEKKGFLTDARATVIAAIITGLFALITAIIGYFVLTSSAQVSNALTNPQSPTIQVLTQTPLSATPFSTLTP